MINPEGIPSIPGDMDVLNSHATKLGTVGDDFADTGEKINTIWQGLSGVYDAPEVGQLLAATTPVKSISASVGSDIGTVAGALGTYATEVRQIKAQLESLRGQAQSFVDENGGNDDWKEDDDKVDRNNELIKSVNTQMAAFFEAQRKCANAINALYGGPQYRADDGDGKREDGEYGYTADQLNQVAGEDKALPWGTTQEKDKGFFGEVGDFFGGIKDGAVEFVTGLGALIGRDPTTGEWSWGTAGTAWKGLGTFALAAGVYAVPGGAQLDQMIGVPGMKRGQLGDTLLNAGKSIIAYDDWGKDKSRAAGKATFNVVSAVLGTKGAGAGLRGAGAALEGSRFAAVSRAGTLMLHGGEAIGKLPTVTDLAKGVAGKFPGIHLPNFSGTPHINVPHHVDTPTVHTPDTPNVHTPHTPDVPAPRPGSVGDSLRNTPGTPHVPHSPDAPHVPHQPDAPASTPPAGVHHGDTPAPRHAAPESPAPAPHHSDGPGGPRHATPPAHPPVQHAPTPHEPTPGGHVPQDHTPGDHTPGDHTPGDHTPGDHNPGDHNPGDHNPGDHNPGDHNPGHDAPGAHPDAPGAHTPDASPPHVPPGHLAPSEIPPPRTAADGPPMHDTPLQPGYAGEQYGRSPNLPHGHRVQYLDEAAREQFRLVVKDGKLFTTDGTPFDTSVGKSVWGGGDPRAIFVMDRYGNLYASNNHAVGRFHHSSFLGGKEVAGAGELKVVNGELKFMSDQSGHYRPTPEYLRQVANRLQEEGIDFSDVQFGSRPW